MDGEMDGVSLHEGALPHRSCNLVANDSAGRGSWRGGGAERETSHHTRTSLSFGDIDTCCCSRLLLLA